MSNHIVFLGDSTLDNIVWVQEPEHCIKFLLQSLLPDDSVIYNYAADAFTSKDVLDGNHPNISHAARASIGDPFPPNTDGTIFFSPLEHYDKLENVTHVVLSVGGNDIREILGRLDKLPAILKRLLTNYPKIVERILKKTTKLIIMTQYKPNFNSDNIYSVYKAMQKLSGQDSVETLESMMEVIYQPILKIAREHRLPVIDLSNTFDMKDNDLYNCQIEPSHKGGQIISRLIAHVINHHDFTGNSLFYVEKNGTIQTSNNDGNWIVGKPSQTKEFIKAYVKQLVDQALQQTNEEGSSEEEQNLTPSKTTEEAPKHDESKIAQVMEIIGVNDRNKVIKLLDIDGTIETAIGAYFSNN